MGSYHCDFQVILEEWVRLSYIHLFLLVCISIIHISYCFETETMDVIEWLSKHFHGIQETVRLEIFMGPLRHRTIQI